MSSSAITFAEYLRLTRENSNFRKLWLAQIVSEIGDWFYTLAIYSLLLDLTGKASSVALALVLQVLPQTFVGPLAGVVNDRISRRKVMIFADIARAAIVGSMLFVRSPQVVWVVYPLLFLETVMASFFEPARTSVIPNITSEPDVVVANTLASTTWSFNLAVGSLLGGIVAAALGRDAVFVLNALSFLVSAWLIGRMRFTESHIASEEEQEAADFFGVASMREGAGYIAGNPRLLAMVLLKGGIGVLGTAWVLFPVLGERVFPPALKGIPHARAALFGMSLLFGARGIGALIGPLAASRWTGRSQRNLRDAILVGFLLGGVGYALIGATDSIWIACGFVVLAHAGSSTIWVFSTTLLHLNTEDSFRGRVFSAELGIAMLVIAIASWVAGQAIDRGVPPRVIAVATGAAMLIPLTGWAFALRLWRDTESRDR